MKGARQNPSSEDTGSDFGLCSHLVRCSVLESAHRAEIVLLEEIGAEGARLAVERPYPLGLRVSLTADGFEVDATIIECQPRETDFYVCVRFSEGYRWSPSD